MRWLGPTTSRRGAVLVASVLIAATPAAVASTPPAARPAAPPAAPEPSRDELRDVLAGLALADGDALVAAAHRAGLLHHPLLVDPLRALLDHSDLAVRVAAAEALGELGIPPTSGDLAAVVNSLLAAARSSDAALAVAAVEAAARYPFPDVRTRLAALASTRGTSEAVRGVIKAALVAPAGDEARARMEAWMTNARAEAARLGESATWDVAADAQLRWRVQPDELVRYARDLLDPATPAERAAIVAALASGSDPEAAVPFLVRALREASPAARQRAVAGLARSADARVDAVLTGALRDADAGVRRAVAQAWGGRVAAQPDRVPLLLEWLDREGVAAVRADVLAALAHAPRDALVGALAAAPRPTSDRAIEDGLIMLGGTDAAPPALLARWCIDADAAALGGRLTEVAARAVPDEVLVPAMVAELARLGADEARKERARKLLGARRDPRIGGALVALVARGEASDGDVALLGAQAEEETRAPVLALVSSADERVRRRALATAAAWGGPDVVDALSRALAVAPADDHAYAALLRQPEDVRVGALTALLVAPEQAARRRGILSALISLRDPRVAEAAARLADQEPSLAAPVMDVLEQQEEALAVPALSRLVTDTRVAVPDRVRAIELVARRAPPEVAVERLLAVARDPELDVKMSARRQLHDLDPSVFPDWDPYGRIPLVAVGAGFGASMLLIAHDIADAHLSPAFTGGAGLVLGAATPYLLTRGEDVSLGDASYFASTALWGTLGGWGAGRALELGAQDTRWLTLAGQGVGLAAGALTLGKAEWSLGDALLANTTALEVALTASTLHGLLGGDGSESAAMIAGAATMVPMALLARRLEVRDDLGLMAAAMGHGAWLGAWAPAAFGRAGEGAAGLAIGQGVGYLAGLAIAQVADVDAPLLLGSFAASALGAATLGGLGLSLDDASGQTRAILTEAGSVGGLLALAVLAERVELHANDGWIIGLGGALGAIGGLRLETRLAQDDFAVDEVVGNVALGSGVGVLSGLLVSQLVDASDAELVRSLGGAGVLSLAGFGLGRAFEGLSPQARSALTGAGFLTGLALTAPFAERLTLDDRTLGFGAITGAAFGAWSSQIPRWSGVELDVSRGLASAAVGTSVGFAGGVVLAQALPIERADLPLIASGALVGSLAGVGAGLLSTDVDPTLHAGLVQGLGLAGLAGASALALTRPGALTQDALPASVLWGTHGALITGLLGPAWRGEAVAGSEVAGGALLGASLGLGAGVLAAELAGYEPPADVIAESVFISAGAYAIGAGAGLVSRDLQLGSALSAGLGAAALIGGAWAAPRTDYGASDVELTSLLTLMGAWHGAWLGAIDRPTSAAGASLMGGGLAMLGGMALSPWLELEPGDATELLLITEAAAAIGGGLAWTLPDASARDGAVALSLAGAGGLLASALIVDRTHLTPEGYGLVGLTTLVGAWQGARAVPLWSRDGITDERRVGGAMVGAGVGFLSGLALSQLIAPDAGDEVEAGVVAAAGSALGGGLQLALPELTAVESAALGTAIGVGSYAAGLALSSYTEYSGIDAALVGTIAAFGAWHGVLLAPLAGAPTDETRGGAALAGAGAGVLAGLALAQATDTTLGDLAVLHTFALAGDAVGAGVGIMLEEPDAGTTGAIASAVSLGALGAALWIAPETRFGAADLGVIALGAALGTWHGAWAAAITGDNAAGTRAGGAAMVGLGAGVLASTLVAGLAEVSPADMGEAMALWSYGTAIGGGLALADTSGDDVRRGAWVEAGGLAGLAGAAALADHTAFTAQDGLLVGVLGLSGAWHGSTLPLLMGDDGGEARGGGALVGAGAFALGGHLLTQVLDYQASDVGEIAVGALLGNAMGLGLSLMVPDADARTQLALVDGLGLGGLATMMVLAPSIDVDARTWHNALLFGSLGAALGAAAPATWSSPTLGDVPPEAVAGGALLGATAGLGASALLGDLLPDGAERRESIALGALAGGLTGSGLGLALSEDDRVAATMFEALTVAGAVAVGSTLDRVELTLGDAALGTTWTAYLTWHQLGVTLLTGGTGRQAAGATLASVGVGTLTGAYLVPRLHLRGEQVLMLFAGSVWGSWIGGWSGAIVDRASSYEGSQSAGLVLLASVLGSDVGVGVTTLVLTDLLKVEPTRFAVINLCGLGGMMAGMLGAGFAQEEPLLAGNVIGSLAGLTLGAIVTSFFDFSEAPSPYEEEATAAAPASVGAAPRVLSISEWFPTARVEPTPSGDGERYLIGVVGRWD